ncbi:MAG TPA: hypothetical protein VGI40_23435 [Pirellulaceae bacterium]
MFDMARARLHTRRSKKYWVAALCAASFASGHYLFGADDDESESLLSQYQQATQQLVTEVQPSSTRRPGSATNTNPHTSRLQPAKAQAASAASSGQAAPSNVAQQQKSSRRVKPAQQPTSESSVAKADSLTQSELPSKSEPLANAEAPAKAEPPAADDRPAQEQPADNQAELAQHAPAAPAASEPPPAAPWTESKPLPMVTYIPPQSEVTPKQLAPRMEIITPANTNTKSPRAQDPAAQSAPFVVAKSAPTQAEVWLPANPVPSQPLPQIINVSRQAVAPPKLASTLAELNDQNLPPIVSPDQVPRPGARKKPIQPAAQTTPVLRIDLGKK